MESKVEVDIADCSLRFHQNCLTSSKMAVEPVDSPDAPVVRGKDGMKCVLRKPAALGWKPCAELLGRGRAHAPGTAGAARDVPPAIT